MGTGRSKCCQSDSCCSTCGTGCDKEHCSQPLRVKGHSQPTAEALSYAPPPPQQGNEDPVKLLRTKVPSFPQDWVLTIPPQYLRDTPSELTPTPTPPRPGEPQNKVYVQFCDNFEGFLPYLLLITEEHGLMFTSLSHAADFSMDPINFLQVFRVEYDALMKDSFFSNLSRSIREHKSRLLHNQQSVLEDCVRPPYPSLVQCQIRQTSKGGSNIGRILVFISVQNDPLANDLVRGCHALKKKRVIETAARNKRASLEESQLRLPSQDVLRSADMNQSYLDTTAPAAVRLSRR